LIVAGATVVENFAEVGMSPIAYAQLGALSLTI
jgi:hypothetical protein